MLEGWKVGISKNKSQLGTHRIVQIHKHYFDAIAQDPPATNIYIAKNKCAIENRIPISAFSGPRSVLQCHVLVFVSAGFNNLGFHIGDEDCRTTRKEGEEN